MNEIPRSKSNPQPSTLCIITDGAGQIRMTGRSLPWLPPHGLIVIEPDGRRRAVNPDGSPGRYLS